MKIRSDNHRLNSFLRLLGLKPAAKVAAAAPVNAEPEPIYLKRNGWMPNNPHLPVLIYRGAIEPIPTGPARKFEDTFRKNWWMPQSRNSIYDFHHYHSTTHEVLGFARGHARLILGGEGGMEVDLFAGDVLVLPVGTGHCKLDASRDLLVIGAYPQDMDWDICKTAATTEMLERMRRLEAPGSTRLRGFMGA